MRAFHISVVTTTTREGWHFDNDSESQAPVPLAMAFRLVIDALLNTNLLVMIGFGTGPGLFLGGITGIIFSLGRKKKAKSNLG